MIGVFDLYAVVAKTVRAPLRTRRLLVQSGNPNTRLAMMLRCISLLPL